MEFKAIDMGILIIAQLHWMILNKNKNLSAIKFEYFTQVSSSFKNLMDISPKVLESIYIRDVVTDGDNKMGARNISMIQPYLDSLHVQIKKSSKEKVGANFVHQKVTPQGIGTGNGGEKEIIIEFSHGTTLGKGGNQCFKAIEELL